MSQDIGFAVVLVGLYNEVRFLKGPVSAGELDFIKYGFKGRTVSRYLVCSMFPSTPRLGRPLSSFRRDSSNTCGELALGDSGRHRWCT